MQYNFLVLLFIVVIIVYNFIITQCAQYTIWGKQNLNLLSFGLILDTQDLQMIWMPLQHFFFKNIISNFI